MFRCRSDASVTQYGNEYTARFFSPRVTYFRFILPVIQFLFLCSLISMSVTPFGTAFTSTVHKLSTDAHIGLRVSLYTIVLISVPSRDEFPLPNMTSEPQVLAERCIS